MAERPIIKTKAPVAGWKPALSQASTLGVGSLGAAVDRASARLKLQPDDLLRNLHTQLYLSKQAEDREASKLTSWINRLTGANPGYVELAGLHLTQVLEIAEHDVLDNLNFDTTYLLRSDVARSAYDFLKNEAMQ